MPPIKPPTEWVIRNVFPGMATKKDKSKVDPGACVAGQNVSFNDGDKISSRKLGYENYPDSVAIQTSTTKVHSIHTFRKRDGTNIMVRGQGSALEAYDEDTNKWIVVASALAAGIEFGFADYNINTDLVSQLYLCNGVQNYSRWAGGKSQLAAPIGAADTTVTVEDASGFPTSGTLVIAGIRKYYTSRTETVFTFAGALGLTAVTGSTVVAGLHGFRSAPRGNLLMANDNRMFVCGVSSVTPAVYFSRYGNATDFVGATLVTDSTADAPGIFNLGEGGGGVNGLAFDEEANYIIKRNIIYKAVLTDALYSLTPLKPFDGKSQTIGGIGKPFAGENGIFFITPDKKIHHLTRLPQIDYPQLIPISDPIKPSVDALFFEKARGIVFRDRAYIACATTFGAENNYVLVYNIQKGIWDAPITGWNVTDWTVYNDGENDELFFASNNSKNVFKIINEPADGDYEVETIASLAQDTFGNPAIRKYIDNFFVEGYIAENTTLNISLLFDDNGFTQQLSCSISGASSDVDYHFTSNGLGEFGTNPFGLELIGSVAEAPSLKKFRLYVNKKLKAIPFYSIQPQFSSDGENQIWEIINFGYKVGPYQNDEDRKLYKEIT